MAARSTSRIPPFADREEEATFWESHSLAEFEDRLATVKNAGAARPLEHHLSVRLDAKILGELVSVANRKGVGPSALVRMWVMERLTQERKAETDA